jgi:type II secretory pathway pseudopilin PulG
MNKTTVRQIKKIRSDSGFTLIEMMLVGGIMATLMLGFTGYMYYQSKTNVNQVSQQNYNFLQKNILQAAGQADTLSRSENLHK